MACVKQKGCLGGEGGVSENRGGYWMYEVVKTEDNPDAKELAFLITSQKTADFKTFRVIQMEVNLQGKDSVTVGPADKKIVGTRF